MILLDCTLRDGGYYNNWSFSQNIVNDYIDKISKSGVKIVELAFRFKKKNKYETKKQRLEWFRMV